MPTVDLAPIEVQRSRLGFSSPFPEEKLLLWSYVTLPQTGITRGIRRESGGYQPYPILAQAHYHPARTKLVAGGIRGSKSIGLAMEALSWLPHSDLLWLAGESYDDCRQEFEYLMEAAVGLNWTDNRLITFPQGKYQPCSFETFWGTLVETKSASDPGSLMSRAPDFIGLCEPGKMDIAAMRRSNERLSTKRGLLWLAGTFEEASPWMEACWSDWKRWPNADNARSWSAPSWTNLAVYPQGKFDPEIEKLKRSADTYDQFLRRIAGVPASQPDIIMSDVWRPRVHVGDVPYIRREEGSGVFLPVYAAIDPGYGGESRYVVLVIQLIGNKIRICDEVTTRGKTHEQVIRQCIQQPWWPAMRSGTIDPYAGDSHALGSVSPREVWVKKENGGGVALETPHRLNVDELIRLLKSYFTGSTGYTLEISERCERLRFEMATWKRMRSKQGLGNVQKNNCDAIKALGYFLTHHYNGHVGRVQHAGVDVQPYNLFQSGGIDPVLLMEAELQANPVAEQDFADSRWMDN